MNLFLTILTPTYNREEKLAQLYESLCRQTVEPGTFLWLVADDGSTDGTGNKVRIWQDEQRCKKNGFQIKYIYFKNGGKHRVLNRVLKDVQTTLVMPVDSDDYLTNDAVATIRDIFEESLSDGSIHQLCGFSFLRQQANGQFMSKKVLKDGTLSTFCEERINRSNQGDMAEVWVTEILRLFPFPEYPREKFLGEDVVWIRMSGPYYMRFFNRVIYRSDYLQDGLTNNRRQINMHSPLGCTERARTFLESSCIRTCKKVKPAMQYWIYGHIAGNSIRELYQKRPGHGILLILTIAPAMILETIWRRKQL